MTALVIIPLIAIAAYAIMSQSFPSGSVSSTYTYFQVNGKTYSLTYVAANQSERQKGLMNTRVTNTTTELFVFPQPDNYAFWMYQVNSSLDIIWLNETGSVARVVYLVQDAPGCSVSILCTQYQPSAKANLVLEAKAGFAKANSVSVGTVITFG
jgi:uncharacterized membrane protein (UPF0127 family)